ncbi:MAG TPA: hypothetical protein DCY88_29830 [Cyanobacteria bacterium UBA11372]|nr:hypothetical protein [Cyanobacteria bacterium UBA11372]
MLATRANRLLTSLEDIVSNIEIDSNFSIRHPNYQPFGLGGKVTARFQQTPELLQYKYLSLQLRNYLFGIYFSGALQTSLNLNGNAGNFAPHPSLENNTVLGIDVQFYQQLHASNHGTGYFDPGWQVLREESDGSLAVTKDGLTLHVERVSADPPSQARDLKLADRSATVGDFVAIPMPRNLVQNGFYIAVGDGGLDMNPQTVKIYFNFTSSGAIAVMDSLTKELNKIGIPFKFRVLYNPSDYGRYDAGVLDFERSNYQAIRPIMQSIYLENRSQFQSDVPLFAKLLAPGLALAEEPNRQFELTSPDSFGINCCQIVADALLEAWHKGDESPEARMTFIQQHFSTCKIELQRPYINANSEDIYTPLDLHN